MPRTTLLLSALSLVLLTACSGPADRASRTVNAPAQRVAPEQIQNRPVTTPAPAAASAQAGTSGMLNPPHGEPGHVCGVPVGSPLDGSTAPAAPGVTMQQESFGQPAAAPSAAITPGATGGGQSGMINPPHGEPGHVCGSPVGQPLP